MKIKNKRKAKNCKCRLVYKYVCQNVIGCINLVRFDVEHKSDNVYLSSSKSKADQTKVTQFAMYTPAGVKEYGYCLVQIQPVGTVDIYYRYKVPQLSMKGITDKLSGVYLGAVISPPLDPRLHTSSYYLLGVYRGLIWERGRLIIKPELPKIMNGDTLLLSYNYDNKTISYTHIPKSKGLEKTNFGVIFNFQDIRIPGSVKPCVGFTYGNMGLEKVILETIEYTKRTNDV